MYRLPLERQGTDMAETIMEHHIQSLAASPSLDLTQGSLGDYGLEFDDSEFPYAPGVINGIKCCSKCGATKTPQWREGPFGPKTLCNACGVKRTRKLRAEADGTKRRKVTASPAGKTYVKARPAPAISQQDQYDSYGDYVDEPLPHHREHVYYHPTPSALRRPTRRAAEEAAVKTARYARTGEWAGAAPGLFAPVLGAASPASSEDSLPSSDCPEEVSWTPLAAEAAARSGLPEMPLDCYAAVNLMTMSVPRSEEDTASPSIANRAGAGVVGAPGASPAAPPPPAPLSRADLEATLAKMDGPNGGKLTADDLSQLYKSVPPAKVVELIRLNQELDNIVNEAQAANAAVAAVAAVLAAKQAAALRAREVAVAATKRLRRFMLELDTQFGVNHKTLPRIRTSPKKATSV
ncbi:hypothetical protein Ndes2526B_g01782 [Nannochloris sp. 'desiccata']|nr:hypothetical protein KSW81_005738 [Chlorella desiccata (nom. nud.)]KAH7623353.1 putative GATA transcription factor 23 [Chlorella desiccata (nom. nud.)]